MRTQLLGFLAIITLLAGCGQPSTSTTKSDEKTDEGVPRVQVPIGERGAGRPPGLAFTITRVHEKRKPTVESPFHVEGGEWTYFECQSTNDPEVVFTVGVVTKQGGGGVAWGKAALIVEDRDSGGRFVELFARSFGVVLPKTVDRPHVPEPFFVSTAILGENLTPETSGGFSGHGGGWTATKWFPEYDGESGEVFFNYNLAQRKGEFSEKDAGYGDALVANFAAALRDGPRPERTPENDPNLSRHGPKIGSQRKLLDPTQAIFCGREPGNGKKTRNPSAFCGVEQVYCC